MTYSRYSDLKILNELNYYKQKYFERPPNIHDGTLNYGGREITFNDKSIFDGSINLKVPLGLEESIDLNEEFTLHEGLYILKNKTIYNLPKFYISLHLSLYGLKSPVDLQSIKNIFYEHYVTKNKLCKPLKDDFKEDSDKTISCFSYREISKTQNKFHLLGTCLNTAKDTLLFFRMNCNNSDADFWEDIFMQISKSIIFITAD